jgi:hypothetical protein
MGEVLDGFKWDGVLDAIMCPTVLLSVRIKSEHKTVSVCKETVVSQENNNIEYSGVFPPRKNHQRGVVLSHEPQATNHIVGNAILLKSHRRQKAQWVERPVPAIRPSEETWNSGDCFSLSLLDASKESSTHALRSLSYWSVFSSMDVIFL